MLKWIETTGRSEEDAISAALFQLGLERDDVSIEVIERAKSGFLGFGSNPAKVRVSYEEEDGTPRPRRSLLEEAAEPPAPPAPQAEVPAPAEEKEPEPREEPEEETILAAKPHMQPPRPGKAPAPPPPQEKFQAKPPQAKPQPRPGKPKPQPRPDREESQLQEGDEVLIGAAPQVQEPVTLTPAGPEDAKAEQIKGFLSGLMEHMKVQAVPEVFVTGEGGYKVILQGQELGSIIGRRGETLDAIQQLTSYTVNRGQPKRVRVHVDAEGYRAKRESSLQRLALKMAGKVVRYRKNMTLEPMNAYERHVIHTALQDYPNVTTYSTGVEPNRRTVVAYSPKQK